MNIPIGTPGIVTIRIGGPESPGEVMVDTAGGSLKLRAYATEEIALNMPVVVYGKRPGGIEVTRED